MMKLLAISIYIVILVAFGLLLIMSPKRVQKYITERAIFSEKYYGSPQYLIVIRVVGLAAIAMAIIMGYLAITI